MWNASGQLAPHADMECARAIEFLEAACAQMPPQEEALKQPKNLIGILEKIIRVFMFLEDLTEAYQGQVPQECIQGT